MKTFYEMENVGRARYTVNFHDGVSVHKDGSEFYALRIFSNRKAKDAFTKQLRADGYREAKSPLYR